MPVPIECLRLKSSSLHSIVLGLFNVSPHQNHRCWVENLCISVSFLTHALNHEAHVIVEGAHGSGGRGFTEWHKKELKKKDTDTLRCIGTTKAMELVVEGLEGKIVAASVHATKAVCFLSSSCTEVKGTKKTRKAHNADSNTIAEIDVLRLKVARD